MIWMVLVHLSYVLKNKIRYFMLCCLLMATQPGLSDIHIKKTNNFNELREEVLQIISKSQKRIWLTSDFLTDGDIVTALYFAKVRKLHVFVLLGQRQASDYRSRLNYLKQNKIPTYIRPPSLKPSTPTLIYSDSRLYKISRDLNTYKKKEKAIISLGSPSDLELYKRDFIHAIKHPMTAKAKPVPLVGRRSRNKNNYYKKTSGYSKKPSSNTYKRAISPSGSYHYDKSPKSYRPPSGVNTSLPKVPVYMKKKN